MVSRSDHSFGTGEQDIGAPLRRAGVEGASLASRLSLYLA
jgi:hypothetical protein